MPSKKNDAQPSKVEKIKESSRHLRGQIAETLAGEASSFEEADIQLLKFHGIYQQDDRDQRRALRAEGKEKAFQFMVRLALPGGVLSGEQYLVLDGLADRYANGSLRVTTRQGIQFHGVLKSDLKTQIAAINDALMTTLSACGDVERNVMACPAPLKDEAHVAIRRVAKEIAVQLRPASKAYHEIWLDEDKVASSKDDEPFYGEQYLPRKFKTGVTHANDNSIDIYSYDCGLVAILDDAHRVTGYNVLVGGGMGMTHQKEDTYARIASPLGFVRPDDAVETVRTVCAIFRDHGNRSDRRHARLKYLIEAWGMDRFRSEFEGRVTFPLEDWRPVPDPEYRDYVGKHAQDDGLWFYGLFIENGRIADRDAHRLKAGVRAVVEQLQPGITLTANQNILFTDLSEDAVHRLESILSEHGVALPTGLSAARRFSMACPALPTCGLAMSESERVMPDVVDRFESELERLGLRDEPITLRMTGCPNGCARPYTADIAFVGKAPDVYHVFVGGGLAGNRLADLFAKSVPTEDLVEVLRPLLTAWSQRRQPGEDLSAFYQRHMPARPSRQILTGKEDSTCELVQLELNR